MNKPNVVLIMTDQQRFDSLSCYGNKAIQTPNLDLMAKEGVLFENCYVNCPICTPSRSSIMTGKHMQDHGVYKVYDNLPKDEILFTKHLKDTGYKTALFGKLHVSSNHYEAEKRHPNDGFDIYEWCNESALRMDSQYHGYKKWLLEKDPHFCRQLEKKKRSIGHIPPHLHMSFWAAEKAVEFINTSERDQPFFCKLSLFDPHDPYENYPEQMEDKVDQSAIPAPIATDPKTDHIRGVDLERNHSYLGSFSDFSKKDIHKIRVGYNAAVAFIDEQIGKVTAALEKKGISENTLIIFTSDHGDCLGDHGLMVKGAFFYDQAVKVPLIIKWPAQLKPFKTKTLIQPHDIAATILQAAGFGEDQLQSIMPDSKSLLSLAQDSTRTIHDFAVCCYRNSGINSSNSPWDPPVLGTMLRSGNYKLNIYHEKTNDNYPKNGQLFNMEKDPSELNDLWDDPDSAQLKNELLQQLTSWLARREYKNLSSRGGNTPPQKSQRMTNKLK
ncbi:Arylsulfatase [Limihaloglobus sulfuriphilus]|uniref:Arylsulfatase n=1 Tax=Limihaloglobus sulfuriphilus TaxID=1851148 RepID=A0A1Q2MHG6_9BACT|nr:sulfatase-like hydrolase/transferase [Limihaloglobus sulfuriphilus]AQQ71692.1 Arylsulfatase [Limihaloglobus sulfuriphilus]